MDDQKVIEGETPEQPTTPASETPAVIDLAEYKKLQDALKLANREAADRRKKLEAYEKAEADRLKAEMTEADRLKADLQAAQEKITAYETERQKAQAQAAFQKAVADSGLVFVSEKAAEDAFRLVDTGTDAKPFKDQAKEMAAERAYYFKPTTGAPDINATAKGKTSNGAAVAATEIINQKRMDSVYHSL